MSSAAFITDKNEMRDFILAGNGAKNSKTLFTVTNQKTGVHFTFKVRRKDSETPLWFVSYLGGPDNTQDYRYLGLIKGFEGEPVFARSTNSPSADAPSVQAFTWFFNKLLSGPSKVPPSLTFNHEGHCARCGRLLTVDSSVRMGYGPKCANMEAA